MKPTPIPTPEQIVNDPERRRAFLDATALALRTLADEGLVTVNFACNGEAPLAATEKGRSFVHLLQLLMQVPDAGELLIELVSLEDQRTPVARERRMH